MFNTLIAWLKSLGSKETEELTAKEKDILTLRVTLWFKRMSKRYSGTELWNKFLKFLKVTGKMTDKEQKYAKLIFKELSSKGK